MLAFVSAYTEDNSFQTNNTLHNVLLGTMQTSLAHTSVEIGGVLGVYDGAIEASILVSSDEPKYYDDIKSRVLHAGIIYQQECVLFIDDDGKATLVFMDKDTPSVHGMADVKFNRPTCDHTDLGNGMFLVCDFS
ncbi:hypothetical protein NVP1139A_65 [Vibrio phage 1.139.A._10N.261.48.C6]|nr:hypothetical protein NVP1139A_65 [Vibrio phage 1.139.A._10N.261.48.C6]AUR90301.1 hypothetical protein NVP1139B_66 [Vibrio phage 1.139.B._10N.261.48.C6]AUR95621.1 hypothetical protein NVP1209O_64 [Vibrio phage 1.209.O._10N.222.52.B2]